ncbi:MAG: hypothetical protein DRI44_04345, partial [Chlamydiae bacterium]
MKNILFYFILLTLFLTNCSTRQEINKQCSPNVLLVTIDTLRADRVGYISGSAVSKTPNIDLLASKGVVFKRAYSAVPLTLPSHSSIFTGLHPLQLGIHQNVPVTLSPDIPTFTTILRKKGYQTIAAISAEVLSSKTGINQGFIEYDDPYKIYNSHKKGGRIAEKTISAALKLLKKQDENKPVFLWVHLYDPHDPYTPPKGYRQEGDSLYDAEVRYTDDCVGRLIKSWKKFCGDKNNLIVITADHGEGLGEHGEKFHGHFLFDTTLHVPLIITGNKIPSAVRDDIVCLYDICPTILKYCDAKNENETESPAIDLLSKNKREVPVTSETEYPETLNMNISRGYAIHLGDEKLICQPKPEKFNLLNDPKELRPVFTNTTVLKNLLYETVKELREAHPKQNLMDSETISMITSLGYLGSMAPEKITADSPVFPHPNWKSPMQAINFINQAERMFRLPEDSDERLAMMENCYKIDPENKFVIKGLGSLLCKRGKYAEAVKLFDKINPESVWMAKIFYDMTLSYAKQGRKSNAFVCAELAVKRCPGMPLAYQAMAIANLVKGKFETAKSNAWIAVSISPDNKSSWNNFGLINNVMKNYGEAYKAFSASMALTDTNDQKSVMKFGRTCMFMKKYDEAEWAFKKAIELNPNNEKA